MKFMTGHKRKSSRTTRRARSGRSSLKRPSSSPTARTVALEVLLRRLEESQYVQELLETHPGFLRLSARDRHLAQELVYGVVRWQSTLDWLVLQATEGRRVKKTVLQILRLGLYQLFWLDRIPDHAAVNETTELAKRYGLTQYAALVNAILRHYTRERESTRRALEELRRTDPARGYSHPAWLVERWMQRWGRDRTIQLLQWNNEPAPVYARINLLKTTPTRLIELWREEGVEYDFGYWPWVPENLFFLIHSSKPVSELRSWREGLFYIQDPSTYLAVRALEPRPGQRILDLCAAPGGKTTLIAQEIEDTGTILALDVDPQRVQRIEENCHRMGIESVVAGELPCPEEGEAPGEGWFDRVLVDAPCSNTGVMRRRVDLRWRIRPEELTRLQALQQELLHRASLVVKPGGVLVYSTCSLEPEENRQVVDQFLAQHPEFRLDWDQELFPPETRSDGAYVARLIRRESDSVDTVPAEKPNEPKD